MAYTRRVLRRFVLASAVGLVLGCGSSASDGPTAGDDAGADTTTTVVGPDAPGETRAPDANVDARTAPDSAPPDAPPDAGPYVPPAGTSCEYRFFRKYFDKDNGPPYAALGDTTFTHLAEQVKALQTCGAKITLGGMLSLMIYEGGGAQVAFYNDRCAENSYDKSATCWTNPLARYSYQYGLAPVHTSNFHPCADVAYTSKMRARLAKAIGDAGFAPTAADVASVGAELGSFCPGVTPTIVDYYILSAHAVFGVPKSATGNDLTHAGAFPFFTPRVVIDLFFDEIAAGGCASLTSDEAAIGVFGGGDASYRTPSKQATILALWRDFKAASCP